ncbi:E3 ubiquitin-protein ligase RNF103 [Nilaparvata lugens]|uniref:E3 ubiquitin-protein ligase RNF103 n=1 Tax=Nilaparvata lugens TaxID=108931 RepID=UPI00193E0AA7|nr:E3 ubiquitin-protein ligase RNF103 [Nilaparvata lugens]
MRSMWVTIALLLLYVLIVFLGSRIIDIFLWCQGGSQFVDPFVLSVGQLKQLLENRGVSYTGYVEKQELAQLVKESADVSIAEVARLSSNAGNSVEAERERLSATPSSSEFLSSDHFYEQIRCFRLCRSKGWFEPLLLLALPKGTKPKDKVILRSSQLTRPQAIVEWLREELSIRVHKVADVHELEEDWLTSRPTDGIKVLLLTHLLHPPLFLAALSIKFSGRIKFGMLTVKNEEEAELLKKRSDYSHAPTYLVITPEKTVTYGKRKGEHFNFWAMNAFLCSVQPEIIDIFNASPYLFFQINVDYWWKRVVCALWRIVSHNLFLFWAWMVIMGIQRSSIFSFIASYCLVASRYVWLSDLGALIRSDCQLMARHEIFFIVSYCIYGFFGHYILSITQFEEPESSEHDDDEEDQGGGGRGWWEMLSLDCLFRPMGSTTVRSRGQTHAQMDIQLEEGIEMLIERLAVPNLWLQPTHSPDYIKRLPVWKFKAATDDSDEEKLLKLMDDGLDLTSQAPAEMLPSQECAVCLENYQRDEVICGLPCAHTYHHQCLLAWLQTDNHHCPICRWPAYKPHPRQQPKQHAA